MSNPARRRYKARYYKKYQGYGKYNHKTKWNDIDCRLVLCHNVPDVFLARLIGRSLMAVQVKRVRLNKKEMLNGKR